MSLFPIQFQIVSDLHLETPTASKLYDTFKLPIHASNLLLVGDIGLAIDDGLFRFLKRLLDETPNRRIFYVMGNHEAYQMTHTRAWERLRWFEEHARTRYRERFVFLHRTRYDLNEKITILGCTLWSKISDAQASDVHNRLTDFYRLRGIRDWSLDSHMEEHRKDLMWLNNEVERIYQNEPERQIVIATHHSPTIDPRASNPRHNGSSVSSGFVTSLEQEPCWISPAVKLWAFGHTHYNCAYKDESTGKLVVANQKGYTTIDAPDGSGLRDFIVEVGSDAWVILPVVAVEKKAASVQADDKEANSQKKEDKSGSPPKPSSVLHKASRKLKAFIRRQADLTE